MPPTPRFNQSFRWGKIEVEKNSKTCLKSIFHSVSNHTKDAVLSKQTGSGLLLIGILGFKHQNRILVGKTFPSSYQNLTKLSWVLKQSTILFTILIFVHMLPKFWFGGNTFWTLLGSNCL